MVDTAVDVGSADRTVRIAMEGSEASGAMVTRRKLFYRVDDELLKLWNEDDDDGTSIRFNHV
jgi:DNA-binding transcriptional regulator PaaX